MVMKTLTDHANNLQISVPPGNTFTHCKKVVTQRMKLEGLCIQDLSSLTVVGETLAESGHTLRG